MQHGVDGNTRPFRRPFGPRHHQKEWDITQHPDDLTSSGERAKAWDSARIRYSTLHSGEVNSQTIPWVHDKIQEPESSESTLREPSKPLKHRRPLPPRPRNHLNDSRRRPLPPTTTRSENHDVPFSFSSRNSEFTNIHAPGNYPMPPSCLALFLIYSPS